MNYKFMILVFVGLIIIAVLIMSLVEGAEIITYSCYDNNTLLLIKNATACYPDCETLFTNMTQYCAYGCDNNTLSCSPPPTYSNLLYFGIIVLFIIILMIIAKWGKL